MLDQIAEGITNAQDVLSSCVTTKIKRKEEARKSLTNCLTNQHCFLIKELMDQYYDLQQKLLNVRNELFELAQP